MAQSSSHIFNNIPSLYPARQLYRALYDNQFNTVQITDARNRLVESYQLDIQDRVTAVTNLERQTMSVVYGLGSMVRNITRFDGTVVSNRYNTDGLVSGVYYSGTTSMLSYYKNGLLNGIALLLGRRHCGLSLRELGSAVGGVDYHAVSKALTRMEKRVLSDSRLRSVIDKAEKEMFNDET